MIVDEVLGIEVVGAELTFEVVGLLDELEVVVGVGAGRRANEVVRGIAATAYMPAHLPSAAFDIDTASPLQYEGQVRQIKSWRKLKWRTS